MHIENIAIATLKIKDHIATSCTVTGNIVITLAARKRRKLPCSTCGMRCRRHDRLAERTWLHVPVWGMPVFLVYRPWRVRCSQCGIKREEFPWAMGKTRMTTAFVVTLAQLAKLLPVETVAQQYGVSWNTVYAAVRNAVAYGLAQRSLDSVIHIGVDEVSRRKGQIYMTQVYDLDTKRLLWSGEGRGEITLRAFFEAYPDVSKTVQSVCCDMWDPYIKAIRKHLPSAEIVFDKFHLIRHVLTAVDEVRRQEAVTIPKAERASLKRTRFVVLTNQERLTEPQRMKLSVLQQDNRKTIRAWVLKEAFRDFWQCKDYDEATKFLPQWCWMATHSRLKPFVTVAKMIQRRSQGILAYFHHRLTNGISEALNNTAKAISHRARGFRTFRAYSQLLLLCMGKLEMPPLHHEFV